MYSERKTRKDIHVYTRSHVNPGKIRYVYRYTYSWSQDFQYYNKIMKQKILMEIRTEVHGPYRSPVQQFPTVNKLK